MASSWLRSARAWLRSALVLGAVAAPVILMAGPAQAALSGGDWAAATLPAGFDLVYTLPPIYPVSCVHGTRFCVVVAGDDNVTGFDNRIGQGDLVTTDGGASWTGYTDLPSASMIVNAVSCPTVSVCWAAGSGPSDQPEVAKSADGGQTWTLATPAAWANAPYSWWANSIDCVSASTCWIAGQTANSTQNPAVAETANGGATWTTFANLPTVTPDSNGDTYSLNGISCISARICVSVGGLYGGPSAVISTTNGGASWSLSTDPALAGVQDFSGVSCLPGPSTISPVICHAAGGAQGAAGPVQLTTRNGGATWSGLQTFGSTGDLRSISCADARHCWAASSGTTVALAGTSNGGASWSTVTSDTPNDYGSVSCATADFCVATTDGQVWVTSNDGGL